MVCLQIGKLKGREAVKTVSKRGHIDNVTFPRDTRHRLIRTLWVLESMKMESGVASPVDGVIADVMVAVGQTVEAGDLMIRFVKNEAINEKPEKGESHGQVRKNLQGQTG